MTTTPTSILCVLAHQDDEMAMATRIGEVVRSGGRVRCVVLTDGAAGGADPDRRDRESAAVLRALGVDGDDIAVIGAGARVRDGSLVDALDATWDELEATTRDWAVDEILCPAYEGGHADHDAAHVLAHALAAERGLTGAVWQFPLYNGWRTRGSLFRVMAPIPSFPDGPRRLLGLVEALRIAVLCRHYRSQWKTWVGLFPELFVRLVVLRREPRFATDAAVVLGRPHDGPLFYERRFDVPYEHWRMQVDRFTAGRPPWSGQSIRRTRCQ